MKVSHPSRTFLALLLVAVVAGCKGEATTDGAANPETSAEAEAVVGAESVIEEHENGSVAWNIAPDGNVQAAVSGPDGKPIKENVNGTLVWKASGEAKTVPLVIAKSGVLMGTGPKLEGDLTEIDYTVTVEGKPWTGTLHVPAGGTAELVASAKAAAEIDLEGKVGPHGGVIQIVGKDRVELVADEVTGEVRVYILDAELNAVAVGDRKVTIGVVAEAPQIIVLASAEGGAYFKGKWKLDVDPLKVTIAVRTGASVAVALVGFKAGAKVAVHAKAPRLKVRVKAKWAAHVDVPDVDMDVSAKARAKAKASLQGPSVEAKVKAPEFKPPKVSAKAKAGASVKFP